MAGNRCESCSKMVSLETREPDTSDFDPSFDGGEDGEGQVTGSIELYRDCAECSSEMKSTTLEIEAQVVWEPIGEGENERPKDTDLRKADEECHHDDPEITVDEIEVIEELITKDRHGKPIKSSRYMKTEIGVRVQGSIECGECGRHGTWEGSATTPASGFDDLN